VNNLWDLTSPEWAGKVALQDPLAKPNIIEWFNQMSATYDGEMRAAYKAETGKDLQTAQTSSGQPTAGQEWVKALAGNRPILTNSDDDVSAAVGAPNQTEQRIGLVSIAKFRDVANKGYKLAVCTTLKPYVGYQYPKFGAIATGTTHPNAAKLFMHFAMTEEGIATEMTNGGVSGNTAVAQSANNPSGLTDWDAQLMSFPPDTLLADFRDAEGMQDLWRLARG
jgi:iron(III) transport system substrate-binding protein